MEESLNQNIENTDLAAEVKQEVTEKQPKGKKNVLGIVIGILAAAIILIAVLALVFVSLIYPMFEEIVSTAPLDKWQDSGLNNYADLFR